MQYVLTLLCSVWTSIVVYIYVGDNVSFFFFGPFACFTKNKIIIIKVIILYNNKLLCQSTFQEVLFTMTGFVKYLKFRNEK